MRHNLQAIKNKIVKICEAETAVVAAFLFGSYAKGTEKRKSDIDIALLLDNSKIHTFSQLYFNTLLEKRLGCRVDLINLNNAGELLKYEIRRNGLLVFERSSKERKQFEVRSRKYFEDFLFLHKKYVSKVLYGGFNGE